MHANFRLGSYIPGTTYRPRALPRTSNHICSEVVYIGFYIAWAQTISLNYLRRSLLSAVFQLPPLRTICLVT